jgi:hypothetical protein
VILYFYVLRHQHDRPVPARQSPLDHVANACRKRFNSERLRDHLHAGL